MSWAVSVKAADECVPAQTTDSVVCCSEVKMNDGDIRGDVRSLSHFFLSGVFMLCMRYSSAPRLVRV